jgi:serine/threonine protein kinase
MRSTQRIRCKNKKLLGRGMIGTTYRCTKKHALKIQHILPSDRIRSFKHSLWREIDLYEYINTLSISDQSFFTKLYKYEIINNCPHKQRDYIDMSDTKDPLVKTLTRLNKSQWCVQFLFDYKGHWTLQQFLEKHSKSLSVKQVYSLLLQIIHIIQILHKGGYSHNDLHLGNLMITHTTRHHFILDNTITVPFYGYQISAIDYGNVLHAKFGAGPNYSSFMRDPEAYMFNEMFGTIFDIITDSPHQIRVKSAVGDDNIQEHGLRKIIANHPDFFKTALDTYSSLYPKGRTYVMRILHSSPTTPFNKILTSESSRQKANEIFFCIEHAFNLEFPVIYPKYFGWKSPTHWLIPTEDGLQFIAVKTAKDLKALCLKGQERCIP